MKTILPSRLLKSVLLLDAFVSGAVALLQLAAPGWLAGFLELPRALLIETGVFLVAYVVLLLVLASRARLWSGLVWLVVFGNVGWAVGCVALLASNAVSPNGLGALFLVLHALTVVLFANFEFVGLKASQPVGAASALRG